MSATLDAELFCTFFGRAPLVSVPGRTFPVANYYLEDVLEETNHLIEEDSPYALHFDLRNQSETSILVTTRGGEKTRETHSSQLDESLSGNFAGYSLQTQRCEQPAYFLFPFAPFLLLTCFIWSTGQWIELTKRSSTMISSKICWLYCC